MIFRLLAIVLFSGFSLLYCADPVTIWISSMQDQTYYEKMVKLYQKKVDKKFVADIKAYGFREMPDKLQVAMKTGIQVPDIVQLDEVIYSMYLGGTPPFVDLSERVKKSGFDKSIIPQRLKLFSHKGKVYGLPQSLGAVVLYYRSDVFEKHEILPKDIDTWSKFEKVMAKLAKKKQASLALDWSYLDILVKQRGGDLFLDGKSQLTSPLVVDTLAWLKKLSDSGIGLLPDRGSIFDPVFFSGDIANEESFCIIGADWYGLDMIQQFSPDLAGVWRAMPLPAWDDAKSKSKRRTSCFAGQGLMIYKDSKQQTQSWNFIKFIMENKTANIERYTQGNSFPAYRPAWKDPAFVKPNDFFGNQSLGALLIDLSEDLPSPNMHPHRAEAIFHLRENYFSSVIQQGTDPKNALQQMEGQLGKYMKGDQSN